MSSLYACLYRPPVRVQTSDPADTLAPIAEVFSPRYEMRGDDLVAIDIRGLERLLGSPRAIGEQIRREAADRGVRAQVAVARTGMAAAILARVRPGLTVVPAGQEAAALSPVALDILQGYLAPQGLPASDIDVFRRWGIRTLGALAALPAAELSERIGVRARAWQRVARGEDARPLVPARPDERFEESFDLEWPVEALEPLSFVLTRLLEPLCTRLERRDRGVAVLHVELQLAGCGAGEGPAIHVCRLELPTPIREVRALRTLVLLDLEARPPAAPVDRIRLTIDPTPGRILQHALFTRPHPTPEQLSTLLARLGALMGQDRIGRPVVVDSYRPGVFAMQPFPLAAGSCRAPDPAAPTSAPRSPLPDPRSPVSGSRPPTSALRRCRQPVPARVAVGADGRPLRVSADSRGWTGGMVTACAGPWRTSGEWWATSESGAQRTGGEAQGTGMRRQGSGIGEQGAWDRDEWDVALADGAVYRIFRDRTTTAWFIDAVID